ncbi:MAG: sulfur carrier protein ThiS [bacterium]|nr:sulfur carrier protein ThiS [bacterium]
MRITLNGEGRDVSEGTTVLALLAELGFKPDGMVVQRNEDIVDRGDYERVAVSDGDVIELVRIVGGG